MKRTRVTVIINVLIAFALVFSLLVTSTGTALTKTDKLTKMAPEFLALVQEYPNEMFRVIVQKDVKNKDFKEKELEGLVQGSGGQVVKNLGLIFGFSAELSGKEVEKLAKNPKVRWVSYDAPMISTSNTGLSTVLDRFENQAYTGDDGIEKWSEGWWEGGHDQPVIPHGGVFLVDYSSYCADGVGYCLRLDPFFVESYVYRSTDLTGAASATLSFYRNNQILQDTGEVALQVSGDDGVTWTTLQTYSSANLVGSDTDTFDITDYASSNTQIRFYVTSSQSGFYYIYFDDIQIEYNTAAQNTYRQTLDVDQLHDAGITGQGIGVAVIDSGISAHRDFSGRLYSAPDYVDGDAYGHGTHVAGIIGGDGSASSGKNAGIAPGANLFSLRVSDANGMAYESDVVEALQWVFENKDAHNIRVVNLSVNSTLEDSYHNSPIPAAAEILWFSNIVVVASVGNTGAGGEYNTVRTSPANDPFIITVGASNENGTADVVDDTITRFSAYGTTLDGHERPDLIAPGYSVISALSPDSSWDVEYPDKVSLDGQYIRLSGTSMSAPMVSGAVALLLQDEPGLTSDQVKYRLLNSAGTLGGYPYLDVSAVIYGTSTEEANQNLMPHMLLAKMALIAYWATENDAENIDWENVNWDSVNWNAVNWNAVNWNAVNWNAVNWNAVNWNSVNWNSVNWNSINWNAVQLNGLFSE